MKYLAVLLFAAAVSAQNTIQVVGGHSRPESRITNGTAAILGNFPWQASVEVQRIDGKTNFCGGALIERNLVLTAAQCLDNARKVFLRFGSLGFWTGYVVEGVKWISHSGYEAANKRNDVALIRLSHDIPLNDAVKTIRLPEQNADIVGEECLYVSGFGQTLGGVSERLHYISVKSMTNENCRATAFPNLGLNQMCVKRGQGKSICFGDAGSALIKYTPNGPIHVGIANMVHQSGCDKNQPQGFMRTSKYVDWIRTTAPQLWN